MGRKRILKAAGAVGKKILGKGNKKFLDGFSPEAIRKLKELAKKEAADRRRTGITEKPAPSGGRMSAKEQQEKLRQIESRYHRSKSLRNQKPAKK